MTDHSELIERICRWAASEDWPEAVEAIQSLQAENARLKEETAEFSRAYGLICAERNSLEAEVKAMIEHIELLGGRWL